MRAAIVALGLAACSFPPPSPIAKTIADPMLPDVYPVGVASDEIDPHLLAELTDPGGEDSGDKVIPPPPPPDAPHAISYLEEMGHFSR
jgi:hypothetical protein